MKKCLYNRANHENLDLSRFFFFKNLTNQTKKRLKNYSIFCSRILYCLKELLFKKDSHIKPVEYYGIIIIFGGERVEPQIITYYTVITV